MKSMVDLSHEFLIPCLHKQAICVDATMGNGKDTQFFLNHKVHTVYAFEIQKEVYDATLAKINDSHLHAYCMGHEHMSDVIHKEVDVIVFNFGYCPGFDTTFTTKIDTSMEALKQALCLLKKKGRLALVFYPHEEGMKEAKALEEYIRGCSGFSVIKIENFKENSPYLIGIEKQ